MRNVNTDIENKYVLFEYKIVDFAHNINIV